MDSRFSENFTVVDGYSLASPFERVIAFFIDLLVYGIVYSILFTGFWVIGLSWLGGVISVLYLIFRDSMGFLNYQSIGKKVMKLKVIDNKDGMKLSPLDAFKRNFIFLPNMLYPFGGDLILIGGTITFLLLIIELYQMYASTDHQRLGDQFAETLVIENSI